MTRNRLCVAHCTVQVVVYMCTQLTVANKEDDHCVGSNRLVVVLYMYSCLL